MIKNREEEKAKKKITMKPEPEDWCFDCKDGGELVICDHPKCGKVYHQDCVGEDHSFSDNVKSWLCGRHYCFNCKKASKFCCLGCPNAVCKKCFAAEEFTIVRGVAGLCGECLEIVEIIEDNLDHDSDGNKISLVDKETYECLFKEYWEDIKVKEGLTGDDVSAARSNSKKGRNYVLHTSSSVSEDDSNSNEDHRGKHTPYKRKRDNSMERIGCSSVSEDDSKSNEDHRGKHTPNNRKRENSMEFVGWASKPLSSFLASIGRYGIEPLTQWRVRSLIFEYIKEKRLEHPKDKRKFLPDDKLFPIFGKKVMSKYQIYNLLEFHFSKMLGNLAGEKDCDQNKKSTTNEHTNDQTTCKQSRLSGLIGKPLLKKGDSVIKPSCFASININNINLVYLKRSLVLELSKQPESFVSKVVGAFVRAKVDSKENKQRKCHQLVRVIGVLRDETSIGMLLQVSFIPNAIHISELSDENFTEQECEDLRQKVKTSLLPKLTVGELEQKATNLHEDITKHWIATRLAYLQNQIDHASIRGRTIQKIELLEEREQLEQPWKQEDLLKRVPPVFPELMEARVDDSAEDN